MVMLNIRTLFIFLLGLLVTLNALPNALQRRHGILLAREQHLEHNDPAGKLFKRINHPHARRNVAGGLFIPRGDKDN